MKKSLFFTLVIIAISGINACKQEDEFRPKTPFDESPILLELKNWYEEAEKINLAVSPQWKKSWVKIAIEGSGMVKVPLKHSQFSDSIYWDVLFQKQNETIHALLIQVKVAPEYLAGKIKDTDTGALNIRDYVENIDFTGDVYLYNLDGRFQMGRRFREGKVLYHLHPLSSFKNLEARGRDIVSKMAPIENPYDDNEGADGGGAIDGGMLPGVVVTSPSSDGGSGKGSTNWFIPSDRGGNYNPTVPGAGGDVPIGSGGGSNSGSSNMSIQPNFTLSTEIQAQYPRFTQMVKDLPAIVAGDPTIMDALKHYTNLTENQIREHLTFGQGPEIKISDGILGLGKFNPTEANVLYVQASFVRGLEQAFLKETQQGTAFLLGVTILHEYVHFGRNMNKLDDSTWEFGWGFENMAFGVTISKTNANQYSYKFYDK